VDLNVLNDALLRSCFFLVVEVTLNGATDCAFVIFESAIGLCPVRNLDKRMTFGHAVPPLPKFRNHSFP